MFYTSLPDMELAGILNLAEEVHLGKHPEIDISSPQVASLLPFHI